MLTAQLCKQIAPYPNFLNIIIATFPISDIYLVIYKVTFFQFMDVIKIQ